MGTMYGFVVLVLMALLYFVAMRWRRRIIKATLEEFKEKDDSYTLVVGAYDWGPAVDKIIVNPVSYIGAFDEEELFPTDFTVEAEGKMRVVKDAYFSDVNGERDAGEDHITLELAVAPFASECSPFVYDRESEKNNWKESFPHVIRHPKFAQPITEFNDIYCPPADVFEEVKTFNRLSAAAFIPEEADDEHQHPLIVWLNGAGEGGHDPKIALLGNKVTALAQNPIQSYFSGAYVLVVQTPTVWMDAGSPYDILQDSCTDKSSQYTKECFAVINTFVKKYKNIDRKRIYIGGCSNGGYMTLNMILHYPDYFAAGYPICEAYNDAWLSDSDIAVLDAVPLWFTAARNDTTVPPEQHVIATTERLVTHREGYELHMSLFDDVHDTSGLYLAEDGGPFAYPGHWSWIYALNDQCAEEDDGSMWSWLARTRRA